MGINGLGGDLAWRWSDDKNHWKITRKKTLSVSRSKVQFSTHFVVQKDRAKRVNDDSSLRFWDKKGKTASNYPTLGSVGMLHNVKIYQILALLFSKPTRKQFMYYVKFQTLTHRLRNVRIMQHRHTTERITKQLPEHHSWPFEKQMSLLKTWLTLEFFCRRFSWVFSVVWWITIIFVLPQKYCKRKMKCLQSNDTVQFQDFYHRA